MDLSSLHPSEWFGGGLSALALVRIARHGAKTFPTPENKYGKWLLGLIHFICANDDLIPTGLLKPKPPPPAA